MNQKKKKIFSQVPLGNVTIANREIVRNICYKYLKLGKFTLKEVFRSLSNIFDEIILPKQLTLIAVHYFHQRTSSKMFARVLNTTQLTLISCSNSTLYISRQCCISIPPENVRKPGLS